MKVAQLIALLQQQDPEADVRIEQPTHDYWRSVAASEVNGVEAIDVEHSDYHNCDVIPKDDEDVDGERKPVVLIWNSL